MAKQKGNSSTNMTVKFCTGLLLALAASQAHTQALPTATKTMDISAFGGFQYTKPDFGLTNNTGGTIGFNVTRYIHLPVAPSLEVRGNFSSGSTITEKSLLGGIRGQFDFRQRYHPYVDLLAGVTTIRYDHTLEPPYHPDRGSAYSYGAGVDIDLIRHFQLKLDAQRQLLNFGPNFVAKPAGGDYTLTPIVFVFGIAYRVPFKPRNHD